MAELTMVHYYVQFGLKMGELLEFAKGGPWVEFGEVGEEKVEIGEEKVEIGEVGEDKVEMVEVGEENVGIGEVVEAGEEKVEIREGGEEKMEIGEVVEDGEEKVEIGEMVEVGEEKVQIGEMVEFREEKVQIAVERMKGWRFQGPRKGKSSSSRRLQFRKVLLELQNRFGPLAVEEVAEGLVEEVVEEVKLARSAKGVGRRAKQKQESFEEVLREFGWRPKEELIGGGGEEGEQVADTARPPPPKRLKQLGLEALFGKKASSASLSSVDLEVEETKEKLQQKMTHAEREAALKDRLELEGQVYVKSGSRDKFGKMRSNVGGRPRKERLDMSGAKAGIQGSNRRRPGLRAARREFPAPELLAMGQLVRKAIDEFWEEHKEMQQSKALEKELDSRLQRAWPGWPIEKLRKTASKEQLQEMTRRCSQLHLGKLSRPRCSFPQGSTIPKFQLKSSSMGVRALMGEQLTGPKNSFLKFWEMVQLWHSFERMLGHEVDQADCYLEFEECVRREMEILDAVAKVQELSVRELQWRAEMASRLLKLRCSPGYRKSYTQRITSWMGARFGTPSKYTELSREQEQIRWQMTVQGFDNALWRAAFADAEELKHFVADVPKFQERIRATALLFSDEVPFWVKIGHRKVLFASWEVGQVANRGKTAASSVQMSQSLKQMGEEEAGRAAEKVTQTRGPAKSGEEKYRITLQARQAVLHYFDEAREPEGVILPSIIIVPGVHCRLENIDEDRCWKEDEEFWLCGELIKRKKGGEVPGNVMKSWTDCRGKHPELFKDVLVWQQPSANSDEVLNVWLVQDMMKRFPQGVWQKDLLASAMTPTVKLAYKIGQFLISWVLGGLTPVCQLTDTDIAFILKAFAVAAKDELVKEKVVAAKQLKQRVNLSCSAYEIMRIAAKAHEGVVKRNAETKLVLAVLRRNGQLGYRPNPAAGKLEKVETEKGTWSQDLKEGSHRYPDSWLEQRYNWLDARGRPAPVDWRRAASERRDVEVKIPAGPCPAECHLPLKAAPGVGEEVCAEPQPEVSADDFVALDYSLKSDEFTVTHTMQFQGKPLEIPVLSVEFDEQHIVSDELKELLLNPPKQRRLQQKLHQEIVDRAVHKRQSKVTGRMLIRRALSSFAPELHTGLQLDLKKKTRAEIMRQLAPVGASQHKRKSWVKKATTKTELKATLYFLFLPASSPFSPLLLRGILHRSPRLSLAPHPSTSPLLLGFSLGVLHPSPMGFASAGGGFS